MDTYPQATARSRTRLAVTAAIGFAAALALPWLLVAAANLLPDKTIIAQFDDRVANLLTQGGTDSADLAFRVVSMFGDWLLALVMVAAAIRFAMRRQYAKVITLLAGCAGAALINVILAFTFQRAHSTTATGFESVAQGVSFPSGHSMVALVGYGLLAYFVVASARLSGARQTAFVAATVVLVGLIGMARIYLGVHSVSDVVLGFVAGAVWLATCIRLHPQVVAARGGVADSYGRPAFTTPAS